MTDDYADVILRHDVIVADAGGSIVGVLVLVETDEGLLLQNVAVEPDWAGKGVGKRLLQRAEAEARRRGFDSIYLYTHGRMAENLALYSRIGYVEYARRGAAAGRHPAGDGASPVLVYMRKQL